MRLNFRISDVTLREIDAAWVEFGLINRSEGIRWLLKKGLEKVKEDGL